MILKTLQKMTHQIIEPFQLSFDDACIQCNELIRIVPGKRIVFSGKLINKTGKNETVIIKTFIHPSRAKKHWEREQAGADLLVKNQILTPSLVAQGISEEGVYFLLFRYVKGTNLAVFWKEKTLPERQNKLKELMSVLAEHHSSGLAHQDLHYANFLLGEDGRIYTLDGEEVKDHHAPLNKKNRLQNLALFLAQTFDLSKAMHISLLEIYASLTSLSLTQQESTQFLKKVKDYHQKRIQHYLKKITRECTEVIYEKKQNVYTLHRREYDGQLLRDLLAKPEHYFQDKASVFLKQGNTCTVKSVQVGDERYVIKRYNPKGLAYELRHMGKISRARKSWINAHLLRFMGVLTPEPIALVEQTPALGQHCSYFICQYQEGQSSWDFFCKNKDNFHIAEGLIATLNRFYEYNITHGDLKGSNFLINNDDVWVLDLDALTQHKQQWQFKKAWQRDKLRFLKNWDKKECYKPWKQYFNKTATLLP
ncbi:MAG: hypothetical protein GY694_21165 [Gammaproteobacteria bacterium]|nr:hypothetical protein [Gammaproteobacteria bacterium]